MDDPKGEYKRKACKFLPLTSKVNYSEIRVLIQVDIQSLVADLQKRLY